MQTIVRDDEDDEWLNHEGMSVREQIRHWLYTDVPFRAGSRCKAIDDRQISAHPARLALYKPSANSARQLSRRTQDIAPRAGRGAPCAG